MFNYKHSGNSTANAAGSGRFSRFVPVRWRACAIGMVAGTALMLGASAVAEATTTANTSGTNDTYGNVVAWQTARANSYPKNSEAWKLNSCNHAMGGGYFVAALRNSSGTTFTKTGEIQSCPSSTVGFTPKNGAGYDPSGTFYVNTGIYAGACGGSGCPNVSWTATLTYSIRIPN